MKSTVRISIGVALFIAFIAITWALSSNDLQAQTPDETSTQIDALNKIEPLVLTQIEASGQTEFFIWMTEKADLSPAYDLQTKEEKGRFVFDTLRETAARTQADLLNQFDKNGIEYRSFYIANKILVHGGNQTLLMEIASRTDVDQITANHIHQLQEPFKSPEGASPLAIETNITFINADDVWGLGYTGSGIVLAGNDTGLDETHPTILPHYRGCQNPPTCSVIDHNYNWWDATSTYPSDPDDGHGHGTHTTGTMVGDDGGANQIGVAPGAQTIHCKNMTDGGSGDDFTFETCFEWDLAPWDLSGANPRPDLAPDAINNSWGYGGGGDEQFRDEIAALQAAGILVELSAGNEGSSCSTLRSPGDYQEVLTTGSVDHASGSMPGTITGSSSRGPSALDGDYFPDIMAPGENIRSSLPGNSYASWGGTSMSGPHVTALVGLMWSAGPALRGDIDATVDIIRNTAVPLTGQTGSNCGGDYTTGPNNDWGFGTIDALAAVQEAMLYGEAGDLNGVVTDSSTSNPIEGALIEATLSPTQTWSIATNATGMYAMTLISETYLVEASAFGYLPAAVSNVDIISGTTTLLDFALTPAPSYIVEGYVSDSTTGWPLYASLDIDGYPGGAIWTDPVSGYYNISLPAGSTYTFNVAAWVPGYIVETRSVGPLTSDTTEDFALDTDITTCSAPGYTPSYIYVEDFEANDGGFTHGGTQDEWEWGSPTGWPTVCAEGSNCWGTDLDDTYEINSNNWLQSPIINLTGMSGQTTTLTWQQAWAIESVTYDQAYAEITLDGGTTWLEMWSHSGSTVTEDWQELDYPFTVPGSEQIQIRWRFTSDSSVTYEGVYIDFVAIPGECIPPADGGLVVGNVYDDNTLAPLVGALIDNEDGYMTEAVETPFDGNVDDAFYTLFSPSGSKTFTATMSSYGAGVETVAVVDNDTVGQDFYLGTGILSVDPLDLHVFMDLGATQSEVITLTNTGTGGLNFELVESDGGYMPVLISAAPEIVVRDRTEDTDGGFAPALASASSYPHTSIPYWDNTETAPDGLLNGLLSWGTGTDIPTGARYRAAGTTCDGESYYVIGGGGSSSTLLNEAWNYEPDSDTWTQLADLPVALMNFEAACLDGFIYLVGGYDNSAHTNNFQIYDVATDSWTATTWPNARTPMTAVYDGLLYAFGGNPGPSAETWVYDPGTSTWTQLANMPTANTYGSAITVDDHIYQIGGGSSNTVQRYDPANDTWDASGPQLQDNRMSALSVWYGDYIYVVSGGGSGGELWDAWATTEVYEVNQWPAGSWAYDDENVSTPVVAPAGDCVADSIWGAGGTNGGTYYATNQYLNDGITCNVDNSGSDVPWLSEEPITGTVAAPGTQVIDVTFDAGVPEITQPGDYYATLKVKNDTPYGALNVPITMTVNAATTWGKLEGAVTGLGYCDADPAVLEGADIVVEDSMGVTTTLTTDVAGYYTLWMDEANSPITVTVTAAEHESGMATGVAITGEVTTTVDFDLRWLRPCVSTTPAALEVTLLQGISTTVNLDIDNAGAVSTPFELAEVPGGYAAPLLGHVVASTPRERLAGYDENAISTEGILAAGGTQPTNILAAGDVLDQWATGHTLNWGNGFDLNAGTVWINDNAAGSGSGLNEEFTIAGSLTGANFTPSFGGDWPGDMAYNSNTGMFWQVNVSGDNCLYEWDPSIPAATGNTICSAAWSVSQRGVAYDPVGDTYFVGGWEDNTVWHIDSSGTLISSWAFAGGISGLAYNFDAGILFIQENSTTDAITVVDVATWTVVDSFAVAGFGNFAGAGLAIDCDGNLWAPNQTDNNAYLIDSGIPASLCAGNDIPWLSEDPITGTVGMDSIFNIDVTFDTMTYTVGTYTGTLKVKSDDPVNGTIEVPVTMHIVKNNYLYLPIIIKP